MRIFLFLLAALSTSLAACQDPKPGQTATDTTSAPAAQTGKPLIVLSPLPVQKGEGTVDLCKVSFDSSIPLFPIDKAGLERYFEMESGTYVMVITAGNSRTNLMFQLKDGQVQVLTSNQYPMCLSRPDGVKFFPEGNGFLYDAGKYTKFKLRVEPTDSFQKLILSMDEGMQLGFSVKNRK